MSNIANGGSPTHAHDRVRTALAAACGAIVGAAVIVLSMSAVLERTELRAFDSLVRTAHLGRAIDVDSISSVALLSEDDIRSLGFPLPPAVLDAVIDSLAAHGASVVGIDLFRDSVAGEGSLARATASGTVVMAHKLGDVANPSVDPPKGLSSTAPIGFSDVVPDDDDTVRRFLWLANDSLTDWRSLAFATAQGHLGRQRIPLGASPDGMPRLGAWTFTPFTAADGGYRSADDAGFQYLFPWHRAPRSLPAFTIGALLLGVVPDALIRGRMVFVGTNAPSLPDLVRLPVALSESGAAGTPGVFVHALGASEIVRLATGSAAPLRILPDPVEWIITLLAAALGSLIAWRQRSVAAAAMLLAGALLVCALTAVLAMRGGLWVPVAAPLLAMIAAAGTASVSLGTYERRTRAAIGRIFARHVSPDLAREIWARRDELRDGKGLRPQRLAATILFADLRGFSTRAEQMDPVALLEWIGEFTDAMTAVVMQCGGMVDDFAGDGIKADFGVPVPRVTAADVQSAARDAMRAALAMERALGRLNTAWAKRGIPSAAMRIGIASGVVVAGSIGSAERLKYTVVGDVVNVAARLEAFDGLASDFSVRPCRILIDEATAHLADSRMAITALGAHQVKGRAHPVFIHSIDLHSEEVSHAIA